jgi:carboxymethylenebutenolidase
MDVSSDISNPVLLPYPKSVQLGPNVVLQPPLSRRGYGPALLIITPGEYTVNDPKASQKTLDPEPLKKWAEEGFAVAELKVGSDFQIFLDVRDSAIQALKSLPECTYDGRVAVIGKLGGFESLLCLEIISEPQSRDLDVGPTILVKAWMVWIPRLF